MGQRERQRMSEPFPGLFLKYQQPARAKAECHELSPDLPHRWQEP